MTTPAYFLHSKSTKKQVKPWWSEPSCTCKTNSWGGHNAESWRIWKGQLWTVPWRDERWILWITWPSKMTPKRCGRKLRPSRATTGSAGWWLKAPFCFEMSGENNNEAIPTGIRVKIDEGWWLGCLPRSGLGFKFRMQFDNTMGVIDSDYYFSDNEGHIFAKITNDSKVKRLCTLSPLTALCKQSCSMSAPPCDNATGVRNGGMEIYGQHSLSPPPAAHLRKVSWIVRCTHTVYRSIDWRDWLEPGGGYLCLSSSVILVVIAYIVVVLSLIGFLITQEVDMGLASLPALSLHTRSTRGGEIINTMQIPFWERYTDDNSGGITILPHRRN